MLIACGSVGDDTSVSVSLLDFRIKYMLQWMGMCPFYTKDLFRFNGPTVLHKDKLPTQKLARSAVCLNPACLQHPQALQ